MMAQPVHHQTIDRKRVKVYELRNNDWFDRGTGFCSSNMIPVQSEDGDEDAREPHVIVESEDEPERLLLNTRVQRDDAFQRQQETLIVWTEPSTGMDMALSFQEADGCLAIWNFITEMQQIIPPTGEDSLSDEVPVDSPPVITLPPADLVHLQEIENNMRIMSSSAGGRDALSRCILTTNYIPKLIPLVELAEEFESLSDLHHLCNIIKIILLLNDNTIFENALSDECILGVVGALEYDPDFPSHKANHRDWLSNQGRYKEVVHITDDHIRYKIHETYRLNYLKDVVLARILDDPTFSVLNSLIFYNHVEIISHIQNNADFLNDLFGIFTDPAESNMRKKEGVMFIQQCCSTSKSLQPPMRMSLFTTLLSHGLLDVISFGLRNPDVTVRIAATDILVCMIDHDPQMMRQTIYRQIHEKQPQLTDILVDLLHVEVDLGIKSQVCDALKVLLDFVPVQIPIEAINGQNKEALMAQRRTTMDPQQDVFLGHFYETSAVRLFKPLLDLEHQKVPEIDIFNEGIFAYLNEMICFFLRSHHHRCKFFIMQHNLAVRFAQLLEAPVKHVQLVGVRFMRQLISLRDDFYIRIIMEHRLLEPVLDLVKRCLPRNNLVCSAGLEFFDFFTKEDLGDLTKHLVTTYNEKLQALSYMPTFRDLVTGRYPQPGIANLQQQQPAVLGSNNHVAGQQGRSNDDGTTAARMPNGTHASLMDSITMDPDEDAYWNGEDDDELQTSLDSPENDHVNGDSSVLKQLVDYPSDEETDEASEGDESAELDLGANGGKLVGAQDLDSANESAILSDDEDEPSHDNGVHGVNGDNSSEADDRRPLLSEAAEAVEAVEALEASKRAETADAKPTTPSASTGPPPERVSEKRRREEDEEDELTKMMLQNKRRNSRSSSLNSKASAVLQRIGKTAAVDGHTTDAKATNKISIHITSPSLQAVGAETGLGQSDE